jgi:hypothetical protein
MRAAIGILVVALAAGRPMQDERVRTLIAGLDGLPDHAPLEAFLHRPALMELLALADQAAPGLVEALECSPSGSVRASALYILGCNGFEGSLTSGKPLSTYLVDPDPRVRLLAAGLGTDTRSRELLSSDELQSVFARFPVHLGQQVPDWLPGTYSGRRLERFLETARTEEPFSSPPATWEDPSSVVWRDPVAPVHTAILKELALSSRGHATADRLLDEARREGERDERKDGFLLSLLRGIAAHQDASHGEGGPCPRRAEYAASLQEVAERRLWVARDPHRLDQALALVEDAALMGRATAGELLDRLAREHPIPEFRRRAGQAVRDVRDLSDSARKAAEARAKRAVPAGSRMPVEPLKPLEIPRSGPGAPGPGPREDRGEGRRSSWSLGILLLAAAAVLFLRRRKPAR